MVPQVGAPGFEPGTSCSQSRRDTRLRYAPRAFECIHAPKRYQLVEPIPFIANDTRTSPSRELRDQGSKRPSAVAHTRLLLHTGVAKRATQFLGEKVRIVAESIRATRLTSNAPSDLA